MPDDENVNQARDLSVSDFEGRHPGTLHLLRLFDHGHLPDHLAGVSRWCRALALDMAGSLNDGPELTAGLRKLLEAKDCFVRQAVVDADQARPDGGGSTGRTVPLVVRGVIVEAWYIADDHITVGETVAGVRATHADLIPDGADLVVATQDGRPLDLNERWYRTHHQGGDIVVIDLAPGVGG